MKSAKAIYTTNNAYDTIVLRGSAMEVDQGIFEEFLKNNQELDEWDGKDEWLGRYADIKEAAKSYGEILAYYDNDGKLVVVEPKKWEERNHFWLN